MGYESRIYVVSKSGLGLEYGKTYASVIAVFNASKYAGLPDVFQKKTDCYIYADDGNTMILEDCYGEELKEAPLADVISFLEGELERGETYCRIKPLLALLKSFDPNVWGKNLVCLHYGY